MKKGKTLMEVFAEADGLEMIRLRKSINRLKRTMNPAMADSADDSKDDGDEMAPEYKKKEQKPQKGRFNVAGQVITHQKLKGEWIIVATQMAGGFAPGGHDDYPNGHEIVLRNLMWGSSENIDWSVPEKRFYQSGCFIPEVMLTNPKVVRSMAKKGGIRRG